GQARSLTPNLHGTVTSCEWISPESILFGENVGGESNIVKLRTLDGAAEILRTGWSVVRAGSVIGVSVARDGITSAVIHEGFRHPPEIWTGPINGDRKQITNVNKSTNVMWGGGELVRWRNENLDVQGWMLPPAKIEPDKKYPMVVAIHG